jgi:hypothetical protein
VLGIVVASTLFLLLAGTLALGTSAEPSTTGSWVKVVLGLLLLAAVPWASGRATPGWPSVRRRSHPADDSGLTAQQPQYGLQ